MVKELQLRVNLVEERKDNILQLKAAKKLSISTADITSVKVLRKSIDARKKEVVFNYKVAVYINEPQPDTPDYVFEYQDVSNAKEIHIVGFG